MNNRIPASVPFGTATVNHPFSFRGHWYRRIEDAAAAGAILGAPATPEEIAAAAAHSEAYATEQARLRAERKAADAAQIEKAEQGRHEADRVQKARHDEAMAYIAGYRGTWGLVLDLRADRRWGTKYMRLSDRQVDVLLAAKARDEARAAEATIVARHPRYDEAVTIARGWFREYSGIDNFRGSMTERVARGEALSERMVEAILRQAPVAPALAGPAPISDGLYVLDGTPIKVQKALNGSGQLYAKRFVDGSFVYEQGLVRRLGQAERMTREQAAEFGHLYGKCIVCGRPLTDEDSIAAGIGPICAGREW